MSKIIFDPVVPDKHLEKEKKKKKEMQVWIYFHIKLQQNQMQINSSENTHQILRPLALKDKPK